jgi:hypothetical protein
MTDTTDKPRLGRYEALRQVVLELAETTRPKGFTAADVAPRMAELGHCDPPRDVEIEEVIELEINKPLWQTSPSRRKRR